MSSEYWLECVSEALEEVKLEATESQIKELAEFIEGAHETCGMYNGEYFIPDPLEEENKKLKSDLDKEKSKEFCKPCLGKGYIRENFGTKSSTSECYICRGEGKK